MPHRGFNPSETKVILQMPSNSSELHIIRVSKSFQTGRRVRVPVLREASLWLRRGEAVSVLGPTGCGKSTLLRLIAGLDQPDSGSIAFDGETVDHLSPYQRGIGLVFQNYALYPHCKVHGNIAFDNDETDPVALVAAERSVASASALDDPLLFCLVALTQLLERPASPEALKAGLPLEDGRLTPDLAVRAAARAGLSARLVRRDLAGISDVTLPCILLLEGRGACVLVERRAGERALVVLPETAEQVVERQHRVGLAAAEVGLQLDDRIAAGAREPLHGADQQARQPGGEKGAAEEFGRVAVFRSGPAATHLRQIGSELGDRITACGHVRVRRDDLAPRLQSRLRRRLQRQRRLPPLHRPPLLGEHGAQHLLAHGVHLLRGLAGGNRLQQPLGRVERPVRVAVLLVVIVHAMAGIRVMLTDFGLAERWHRGLVWLLAACGLVIFLYFWFWHV